jgi:glyoxylase-like metal-dependent hydrolase (beta-lactamase superfamily II)
MLPPKTHESLHIGDIELSWLQGGFFHLDGGTMFGPVPKILWQKQYTVDDENLIPMCNDPILVHTGGMHVLIDSGLGNKLNEKQQSIYKVTSPWDLPAQLERRGISRNDIDLVILTHCDFDHAGGILMQTENGHRVLAFPKAQYIIHEREWQDVQNPNSRAQSTYLPENFDLLEASGHLSLTTGAMQVCPGITVHHTGGHTRGHQVVEISSQGESAIHLGDLCPTHAHLNPLWVMAYDNFPLDVIAQKEAYLKKHREMGSWFTFYHDPFVRACKLGSDNTIAKTW